MDKGTILYVGGFELPDKNAAAHRVINNAKIFKELGYKVVLLGVDRNIEESIISYNNGEVYGFSSWAVKYPKSVSQWIKYLINIDAAKAVFKEYNDIKLIIAYNYQAAALFRLLKFCRKQKIKIAADCTEWYSIKEVKGYKKIIKGLDTFFRMRVLHKKLNGLILISKYLANYYSGMNCIVKIPPLIDSAEDKWKVYEHNSEQSINLAYAGMPGKTKDNIGIIVESLYELQTYNNYIFRIIGMTKKEYLKQYPNHKIQLEKLKERIIFTGRLPHEDTLKIIHSSDFQIFVREESRLTKAGFPTKFVESVSLGVPVISTANSDIGEYIYDCKNGFIVKDNLKDVLEKVLCLTNSDIISIRDAIKKDIFDYRNYASKIQNWLKCIGVI